MTRYVAPLRFALVLAILFVVFAGCAVQEPAAPTQEPAAPTQAPESAQPAQPARLCNPEEQLPLPVLAVQNLRPDVVLQAVKDLFPPRVLCDIGAPAYKELGKLEASSADDLSRTLVYTNDFGQTFEIRVDAASPEALNDYIGQTRVCFEAIPSNPGLTAEMRAKEFANRGPQDVGSVDLAAVLIETTDIAPADLAARRDVEGAAGRSVTLAEILSNTGKDPGEVRDGAANEALNRITTALNDGWLSWPDVQNAFGLDPSQAYDEKLLYDLLLNDAVAMLCQPDAPYLAGDFPRGSVAVGPTWLPTEEDQKVDDWIIWYAIDPTINKFNQYNTSTWLTGKHYYYQPWAWWAYAQLAIKGGTVSNDLSWKDTKIGKIVRGPVKGCIKSSNNGSICAVNSPVTALLWSYFYWPPIRFDSSVMGGENNSQYTIYGGWNQCTTCK
jgi:hypothetical protein